MIEFRKLEFEDTWDDVQRIQALVYKESLIEDIEVLKLKSKIANHECSLVFESATKAVIGYVLIHPYSMDAIPLLDTALEPSSDDTQLAEHHNMFLHDFALVPNTTGKGKGREVITALITHLRTLHVKSISLVAVQSSHGFWERVAGFKAYRPRDSHDLAKYGKDALAMRCFL